MQMPMVRQNHTDQDTIKAAGNKKFDIKTANITINS